MANYIIKKRKPKVPVPEDKKDVKYWEMRKKNNNMAKKYRDRTRKQREESKKYLNQLIIKNQYLKNKINELTVELETLRNIKIKKDNELLNIETESFDFPIFETFNQWYI